MAVSVTAFARLHLGLLAPTAVEQIIDGGVGLALQVPSVHVRLTEAAVPFIEADSETVEFVRSVVSRFEVPAASCLSVQTKIPRHIGLGSGTQIALAVAEVCAYLSGETLSQPELWRRANRGSTSKVGCAAYAGGGLILDLGRSASSKAIIGPSNLARLHYQQNRTLRFDFPDWDIMLCLPHGWPKISGIEEAELFNRLSLIPRAQVLRLAFIQLHRLVPAVLEHDLGEFDCAIRQMRDLGFKRREMEHRGRTASDLVGDMEASGLRGVTMSSWGGTTVGFSEGWSLVERQAAAVRIAERHDVEVLWTKARNAGRRFETTD